ncbi:MAG: ABC transporter permease subunit, partial [Spirochaetales bacterium]|nr:ABC transporter permease subunit [Spirochaetales bacterium]
MKYLSDRIINKTLERFVWIGFLVIIWATVVWAGDFSPLILPSPALVIKALFLGFSEGPLGKQILISLVLVFSGMCVGTLIAFLLLLLAVFSSQGESFVTTMTAVFHPLAGIALLPVIILWFGTGALSIIFIIIHSVVWPMVTNLIAGYRSIPEPYRIVGRNYELTPFRMFLKITIPGSFPYILAGLKISWARAWRALISAEMIFGAVFDSGGVGWFIFSK